MQIAQTMKRAAAAMVLASGLGASALAVPLPPGSNNVPLPGTSSAADPTLAGVVIADAVRPFEIFGGGGALLFRGEIQSRVIRSNVTNTLYFGWRIINTQPGLNGIVGRVEVEPFKDFPVRADWRMDTPGATAPNFADRNGSGSLINYDFLTPPLFSGSDTKLFFAFTDAARFNADGCVTIYLTTGEFVTLPTFAPGEPCDSCRGDVNGDGVVNFEDLNEVLSAFGNTCPPIVLP